MFGIALGGTTAGSLAVRASNPLPVYTPPGYGVQLTDGTRLVDIVSEGTANSVWKEGIILLGKDTAGTFYPVPLTAGGDSHGVTPKTSVLNAGNSTTDQLGNGEVFTGAGIDCIGFSQVAITVHSDKDSATDGMQFQFSQNNSDWDDSYDFNLDESVSQTRRFQFPVTARYFRVKYTNGTVLTTALRIQTILHASNILTSIHRIDDVLVGDRSTVLGKSFIIGESSAQGGIYVGVKVNPSGSLETNVSNLQATAATVYNIAINDADTEYPQVLPANIKRFAFQCRSSDDIRFAFEAGKVATPTAPYMTLKADQSYWSADLDLASGTLHVACASATKVVELICWV